MQKYSDVVLSAAGTPVAGAVITVTTYPDGAAATIYGADGGPSVASVTTDLNGRFSFYAANGHYSILVSGTGITPVTYNDVLLFDPLDNGAATVKYGTRTLAAKLGEFISAKDAPFNAKGDGTVNDTAALQAWVNYLLANKRAGWLPAGVYLCTATILKGQDAVCPSIYGEGKDQSIIKGPAGAAVLKLKGGSGTLAQARISGIGFDGNVTGYGIEVADQCGVTIEHCNFINSAIGLLLHNETSGGFTEYVVAEHCTFAENCKQALVYKRTAGNDSFHGSGLRFSQVAESSSETVPKIEIGGALSTLNDIVVYNAPLYAQFWKQTAQPVIKNNSTRSITNYYGALTFETFGSNTFQIASGTKTHIAGTVNDFSSKATRGAAILVDTFAALSDGSTAMQVKPYRLPDQTLAAGANNIFSPYYINGETFLVTAVFTSNASPWKKTYLLAVYMGSDVKTVTQVAQLTDYYGGDQPAPAFSMSGGTLVATQAGWPANTIHCNVSVTQMAQTPSGML